MKSVSKQICKNVTRFDDYTLIEQSVRYIEYDSSVYLGAFIFQLSKLDMYKFFYKVLEL